MSYQVIARKYRPQRFADVVGQDHVTQTLANAVRQGRIAHAYIFCGPRGTGKTTIARIFAKCLNCTEGPAADFDDADPRCREIAEGRSMDVLEIDGASNRGIDEVRELRETVKYAPASSRFKIYIIDEVHMLTKEAFNALLKTLEEPPAHVKFMFATTDPEKVLPTILSRCQRFDLRRIPSALIVKHLAAISAQEEVEVEPAALQAIARGADGCMRDAESTLDQLISFCGHQIVEADVLSMFGLTARTQITGLARAVLEGDQTAVLREVDDLARNGKDLGRLLSDLLEHFRNLLILQVGEGKADWLETTEVEAAELRGQLALASTAALTRVLEVLSESEGRFRDAISKKIMLEVTLMRASEARNATSLDAVLQELNALRAASGGDAPPLPSTASTPSRQGNRRVVPAADFPNAAHPVHETPPPPAAPAPPSDKNVASRPLPAAPSPPPSAAASGPTLEAEELAAVWTRVLAALKSGKAFAYRYLAKATPVRLEDGLLTLGFDAAAAEFIPLVDNAKNHGLLSKLLEQEGYAGCRVRFEAAPGSSKAAPGRASSAAKSVRATTDTQPAEPEPEPAPAPPALAAFDPATFKQDPKIKEALEVFKARIVQVIPPGQGNSDSN